MEFGWPWCVSEVHQLCQMHHPLGVWTTGEAVPVWRQGFYGKSLHLPFSFAGNLKLL